MHKRVQFVAGEVSPNGAPGGVFKRAYEFPGLRNGVFTLEDTCDNFPGGEVSNHRLPMLRALGELSLVVPLYHFRGHHRMFAKPDHTEAGLSEIPQNPLLMLDCIR